MQADDAADLLASLRARALSVGGSKNPSTLTPGDSSKDPLKPSFMAADYEKLESFDGARDRFDLKFHAGQ